MLAAGARRAGLSGPVKCLAPGARTAPSHSRHPHPIRGTSSRTRLREKLLNVPRAPRALARAQRHPRGAAIAIDVLKPSAGLTFAAAGLAKLLLLLDTSNASLRFMVLHGAFWAGWPGFFLTLPGAIALVALAKAIDRVRLQESKLGRYLILSFVFLMLALGRIYIWYPSMMRMRVAAERRVRKEERAVRLREGGAERPRGGPAAVPSPWAQAKGL